MTFPKADDKTGKHVRRVSAYSSPPWWHRNYRLQSLACQGLVIVVIQNDDKLGYGLKTKQQLPVDQIDST